MDHAWYTTRERVKRAVDVTDSARANDQIDRLIEDASRSVDNLCRRLFTPRMGFVRVDWPDIDQPTPWGLWLDGDQELIRLDSLTSGGALIAPGTVIVYPTDGPPYSRIELDRSGAGSFDAGSTPQRNVVGYGLLGYRDAQQPVGVLLDDLTDSATVLDVSPHRLLGVGSVLSCGTERMAVVERSALDTGANLAANLGAEMRESVVALSSSAGAAIPGETIVIDGERMLVTETIGTSTVVTRGHDGTVLAAHTTGADIYAYRRLTVERGSFGTTASAHTTGDALTVWKPEAPVEGLTIAETLNLLAQENSAYARVIGAGEYLRESRGAGLKDRREQVVRGYRRAGRTLAV